MDLLDHLQVGLDLRARGLVDLEGEPLLDGPDERFQIGSRLEPPVLVDQRHLNRPAESLLAEPGEPVLGAVGMDDDLRPLDAVEAVGPGGPERPRVALLRDPQDADRAVEGEHCDDRPDREDVGEGELEGPVQAEVASPTRQQAPGEGEQDAQDHHVPAAEQLPHLVLHRGVQPRRDPLDHPGQDQPEAQGEKEVHPFLVRRAVEAPDEVGRHEQHGGAVDRSGPAGVPGDQRDVDAGAGRQRAVAAGADVIEELVAERLDPCSWPRRGWWSHRCRDPTRARRVRISGRGWCCPS